MNLRKIRILLATIALLAITLLFLDFSGTISSSSAGIAKWQFIPAIFAVHIPVIVILFFITLIFGRIYCSILCPLGIMQDLISWCSTKGRKNRFAYRHSKINLRLVILILFVISCLLGLSFVTTAIDPYSVFGRIVSQLLTPIYQGGNNSLAYLAKLFDSYAFYPVPIKIKSVVVLLIAMISLLVIWFYAWKKGRGYCNTICPVGTFLGLITQYSLLKPRFNNQNCNSCGICEKNCKASCLDAQKQKIDYTRCVVCFNCLQNCPRQGIQYTLQYPQPKSQITEPNQPRRGFILLMLGLLTRSIAHAFESDGGLAPLKEKKAPTRLQKIIPPGAGNIRSFQRRCTGCQLCVTTCPNQVLKPTHSWQDFLQPALSFDKGYCPLTCVRCSSVCPSGAIKPITTQEKSATQIGYAVWRNDLCVVSTDQVNCDLCAHHCPTGAITMVQRFPENPRSSRIPVIDVNRCLGCGACEQYCPARPESAIYVEGIDTHRII